MKKRIIFSALCFAAVFMSGNLKAETQAELHEQVKGLTEVKGYIVNPSFENSSWATDWNNNGFQSQTNTAFPEKTGNVYCEKWVASGGVGDAQVYQNCALPNGQYVIAVDAMATQGEDGDRTGFYFAAGNGEWDLQAVSRISVTGKFNFQTTVEGTLTNVITYYIPVTIASGTLSVGMFSESTDANYVRFDNFRIFTADIVPVLKEEIRMKANQIMAMLEDIPGGYNALMNSGENPLYNSATDLADNSTDEEALTIMSDSLGVVLNNALEGEKLFMSIYNGLDAADLLLSNTDYSGKDALSAAHTATIGVINNPNAFNPEFKEGIEDLKAAIKAYKTTQIEEATPQNPVDLTFLIDTPNFSSAPDFGTDDITDQSTASKGAWLTNNVYSGTSKDDRLNYCNSKNCWNNWSATFYSLDLYQTLRNMPEGTYALQLLTSTGGELGNARGYARSTNGVAYSPVHTISTPDNPFAPGAIWEELITSQIYVSENDTLRIGITSSNAEGNNTNGWFCATAFKLFYYGKGDANKQILEMKMAEIELLDVEGSMTEKALNDLRAVIAKAEEVYGSGIFSGEEYETVIAEIDSILPLTENRVAVYAQFKKKDNEISDFVNRDESEICGFIGVVQEEYADKIEANADIDVAEFEQYTKELDQYLTFANTFMKYEAYTFIEEFDEASLRTYALSLGAILEYIDENRLPSLPEAEKKLVEAYETLIYDSSKEGSEVTYLAANPSFESNTGNAPTGWTNKGFNVANSDNFKLNEETAKTGSNFCEQWVASGGGGHLSDLQIYQTVQLPNGVYTITTDGMAFQQTDLVDITGFYLVAKNGEWESGYELIKEPILYIPAEEQEGANITYSVTLMVNSGKLTFGVITENTNANWVMCDNFRITLNQKYLVGIEDVYEGNPEDVLVYTEGRRIIAPENAVIYTINGLEVANSGELQPGVYLVRIGAKTQKISVK